MGRTVLEHTDKWVINLFPNPPYQQTIIPPTKRTKFCHCSQIPPIDAYITATEQASSKTTYPGSRWVQVWCQQASKTTTQQPLQPQLSTMQSPHTAQTRQHKGGSHSGQGGGHGHHGSTRLQQQSTGTSTRHQHLQSFQQGPYPQLKNKLITLLKNIKQSGGLSTQKYKQLYPTSAVPPKFYGLPKIHKTGAPSDP